MRALFLGLLSASIRRPASSRVGRRHRRVVPQRRRITHTRLAGVRTGYSAASSYAHALGRSSSSCGYSSVTQWPYSTACLSLRTPFSYRRRATLDHSNVTPRAPPSLPTSRRRLPLPRSTLADGPPRRAFRPIPPAPRLAGPVARQEAAAGLLGVAEHPPASGSGRPRRVRGARPGARCRCRSRRRAGGSAHDEHVVAVHKEFLGLHLELAPRLGPDGESLVYSLVTLEEARARRARGPVPLDLRVEVRRGGSRGRRG